MFNNHQVNIIDNIKQNCPESCFSDSRCCFRGLPSCRGATFGGNTSLSGYWPAGQRGCSSAWPLSVDVSVFKWEVCPASGRKQLPHIHSVELLQYPDYRICQWRLEASDGFRVHRYVLINTSLFQWSNYFTQILIKTDFIWSHNLSSVQIISIYSSLAHRPNIIWPWIHFFVLPSKSNLLQNYTHHIWLQ